MATQRELAENLIETLGYQRALHVARQFCWYGAAREISRMGSSAAPGVATTEPAQASGGWSSR